MPKRHLNRRDASKSSRHLKNFHDAVREEPEWAQFLRHCKKREMACAGLDNISRMEDYRDPDNALWARIRLYIAWLEKRGIIK